MRNHTEKRHTVANPAADCYNKLQTIGQEVLALTRRLYKYISRNVAGMIGLSVYIVADTFFISVAGGADGITVLNLALPLYGLLYALGSMIGIGAATRYTIDRAQQREGTGEYFSHALLWQLIVSLPFILLGLISPESWLRLMGGDVEIVKLGVPYVRIVLIGAPSFLIQYAFTAFCRNDHASGTAMTASLIASGFNILFDYIFMFPMDMGVAGAALATAMAPLVSALVCCTHILSRKSQIRFCITRLHLRRLIEACKLGISSFVGEIPSAVITTVFNFLLLHEAGNLGVAAYGIVANYALVAMAILNGIAQGMQPLLSESYGRGEQRTLRKLLMHGAAITAVVSALIVAVGWVFTEPLTEFFNSEGDPQLAGMAFDALRYYFLGFAFAGINVVLITFFSSVEQARAASVTSLLRGVIAIIGFAVGMGLVFGLTGIWLSFPAAETLTLCVVLLYFKGLQADHIGH